MPANNRPRPKRFWSVTTPERFAEGTETRDGKTYYNFNGSELLYGELREVVEAIMAHEAADSGSDAPMVPSEDVDATVAAVEAAPTRVSDDVVRVTAPSALDEAITMEPEGLSARVEAIVADEPEADSRTRWMCFQYIPIPSSMHAALVRAQRGEDDLSFEVRIHQRFTY